MSLRIDRLRAGELIVGLSAVLMAVFLFAVPWGTEFSGGRLQAVNGWQASTVVRWLVLISVILGTALVLAQVRMRAPAVPVSLSVLVTVSALITVIGLIIGVLLDAPAHERIGAILELVSAVAMLCGGFLSMRQEGVAAVDAPDDIPVIPVWINGSVDRGRAPKMTTPDARS